MINEGNKKYFSRLERIFRRGYEKSVRYSKQKSKLAEYCKVTIKSINSKLKNSELGSTIEQFLSNIKNNPAFSEYNLFKSNINAYIKKGIFLKRKLSADEADFLWFFHSKDSDFSGNDAAKLLGLLRIEIIFIDNSLKFITNLAERFMQETRLGTQGDKKCIEFYRFLLDAKKLVSVLIIIVKNQEHCLANGKVQEFLSELEEEKSLKDKMPESILKFLNTNNQEHSRREFIRVSAMGLAGIFLSGVLASQSLAGELTKGALKNKFMAEFIEYFIKDVKVDIKFEWEEGVQLQEQISRKAAEELVSEAVKYGIKWYFTYQEYKLESAKPKEVVIVMGTGKYAEQFQDIYAAYEGEEDKIFINPRFIKLFLRKDAPAMIFFGAIFHEIIHLIDYHTYPEARQNHILAASWMDGKSLPKNKEEIDKVLSLWVKFSEYTEERGNAAQIEFLEFVIKKTWPENTKITENDKKIIGLFEKGIEAAVHNLELVKRGEYGNIRQTSINLKENLLKKLNK